MMLWLKKSVASTVLGLLCVAVALTVAGCKGSSETGGSTDPTAAAAATNTTTNAPEPAADTNAAQTATNSTSQ